MGQQTEWSQKKEWLLLLEHQRQVQPLLLQKLGQLQLLRFLQN